MDKRAPRLNENGHGPERSTAAARLAQARLHLLLATPLWCRCPHHLAVRTAEIEALLDVLDWPWWAAISDELDRVSPAADAARAACARRRP